MITLDQIRERCIEVGNCWEWSQGCDHRAPVMRLPAVDGVKGKIVPVRRYVLELMGLALGPGQFACSKCGNYRCVAPHHAMGMTRAELQLRTAQLSGYQQSLTRRAKISAARRTTAVLTLEAAQEMRALGLTTREAARRYGVAQSTAADAIAGRTWVDFHNPFSQLGVC